MRCAPVLFVLACGLQVAPAMATDALHTPECRRAVETLQLAEGELVAAARADAPRKGLQARLQAARKAVVQVCLGGADEAPPPTRAGTPPAVGVPSPISRAPAAPSVARPPAVAAPAPTPLRTITSCDAVGCWASDGTRLQKSGPNLLGPSGFCTTQGTVLNCP